MLNTDNYQGNAVINYTDAKTPYTRVMEWKHFDGASDEGVSVVTREYPQTWDRDKEAYYPINDETNMAIYKQYAALARQHQNQVVFGGRLGQYRYYDMDQVFHAALTLVRQEFNLPTDYVFTEKRDNTNDVSAFSDVLYLTLVK
ncbi:UDP-galactopyranose mutase [Weissella viridescens]|uniref:UDP-galactopyranose mutase n=1 Tax=Weissella viridescens TaxID=1629 RepID=A0A380P2V1_WEIVI|nr:UDP-galactopyranose mutase [Weissella viridescens]